MRNGIWFLVTGIMTVCLVAGTVSAVETKIYEQVAQVPPASVVSSQYDSPTGDPEWIDSVAYDGFRIDAVTPEKLTRVTWQGEYNGRDTNPDQVTDFILEIRGNTFDNRPDVASAALGSVTIPIANASETSETVAGREVYNYSADISPMNFTPTGFTNYWLSIVGEMEYQPEWGWNIGTNVTSDPNYFSEYYTASTTTPLTKHTGNGDLTFALYTGTEPQDPPQGVPEPSTLAGLLGLCFCGLALRRRRR